MIERVDEALALLGRRGTPGLTQNQPRGILGVEIRQQYVGHQGIELGRIALVHRPIGIQLLEHALGGILHHFLRAHGAGGRRRRRRLGCIRPAGQTQGKNGENYRSYHFVFSEAFGWVTAGAPALDLSESACPELLAKFANSWPIRFSSTKADWVKSI